MRYRYSRSVPHWSSVRILPCSVMLACVACSVFPEKATLPEGQGGSGNGGAAAGSTSNGGAGRGAGGASGSATVDNTGGAPVGGRGGTSAASGGGGGAAEGGGGAAEGGGAAAEGGGGATEGGVGGGGGAAEGGETVSAGSGGAPGGGAGGTSTTIRGGQAGGGAQAGESGRAGGSGCSSTTNQLTASADTYITNAKSEARSNFGSAALLALSGEDQSEARALVNFDWSALPQQGIQHAALRVVLASAISGERTLSLYRVARVWAEGKASWLRASAGQAGDWSTEGGDAVLPASAVVTISNAPAGAVIEFDLDSDPLALTPSNAENYGFLLRPAPGQASVELSSREGSSFEQRPTLVLKLCP